MSIKNFSEYLKEEIDIDDVQGLGDDFKDKSNKYANKELGVQVDAPFTAMPYIMELQKNMGYIKATTKNAGDLKDTLKSLEDLAIKTIEDEYESLLEQLPVEFDIKLLFKGSSESEIDFSEIENDTDELVDDLDDDIKLSVSKSKILRMISQGEGKATKKIIAYSDVVDDGIKNIFGEESKKFIKSLIDLSSAADKLDWIIPIDDKLNMVSSGDDSKAGANQVKWDENSKKFIIKVEAVDFVMLIHEMVKGLYVAMETAAIKEDPTIAEKIKKLITTRKDEAQDFRYGSVAQKMFTIFINECEGSDKYPNVKEKVFATLARDKDRGGIYTDEEFLDITKSLFSCFVVDSKLELVKDKFNSSLAKKNIEEIISNINDSEDEYHRKLSEWEANKELGNQPEISYSDGVEEEEEDYSKLSQREINDLINKALDDRDFDKVRELSAFLNEGREIFLKEAVRLEKNIRK
jgi:hypothetical protein